MVKKNVLQKGGSGNCKNENENTKNIKVDDKVQSYKHRHIYT
jgi:hypothetical protein